MRNCPILLKKLKEYDPTLYNVFISGYEGAEEEDEASARALRAAHAHRIVDS